MRITVMVHICMFVCFTSSVTFNTSLIVISFISAFRMLTRALVVHSFSVAIISISLRSIPALLLRSILLTLSLRSILAFSFCCPSIVSCRRINIAKCKCSGRSFQAVFESHSSAECWIKQKMLPMIACSVRQSFIIEAPVLSLETDCTCANMLHAC